MTNKRIVVTVAATLITALILAPSWLTKDAEARLPTAPLQQSGVPMFINYQGELVDVTTGNPIPDGDYSVTLTIYDDAAGGADLWSEAQVVTVEGGLFSTLLGAETALTAVLFNDQKNIFIFLFVG